MVWDSGVACLLQIDVFAYGLPKVGREVALVLPVVVKIAVAATSKARWRLEVVV